MSSWHNSGVLAAASRKGVADRPLILDGAGDPYAGQYLFVTSPHGIYTFDRNSETWGRITSASGLPDNKVDVLGLDDGILWIATPSGLASADIQVSDWQTYDLPGPVTGIGFDKSYVWAGGAFGLRRFDKYAERWAEIDTTPVNDLLSDMGFVWLATDSGILRYSREFERVEPMPAPAYRYSRIISTPGRTWFIAPGRFVSWRKATGAWSGYPGLSVDAWSTVGDSVFIASGGTVYLYEPSADAWLPFREIEGLAGVTGVHAVGSNIVFATGRGLVVYNASDRTGRTYTRSSGLADDSLLAAFADARRYFAVNAGAIEWLDTETGIWKVERIEPAAARREDLVFIDDAGAHLRAVPGTDVRLAGRAYYSESRTLPAGTGSGYENVNLSLTGLHNSGRSLSIYFDDTDKEQVDYGLGYRGVSRDVLSRAGAGYGKTEYSDFDLIPRFSTIGANARLAHDDHALGLQAGRLQSRARADYFTGRSIEKQVRRRDTDYLKNAVYRIPVPVPLARNWDTVYVDDRNAANNTVGTRIGASYGRITGDFDPLLNGIGYHIDYDRALVRFMVPRKTTDVIILAAGGKEYILQSAQATENRIENIYYFGPEILPGSFHLSITDAHGSSVSLNAFGLDRDEDGKVDPEFIDFHLGLLRFPSARPFPDPVYETGASFYSLDANFRSLTVFYNLGHAPLVRGSEAVRVDGEPLTRGADYIVDNTSGVLLFLRDDIVTDFSQVEIRYSSVERAEQAWLLSAQPDIAVTDRVRIMPGITSVDSQQIVHLSARAETRDRDLRIVSQTAMNQDMALAHDYSATASRGIAGARVGYTGYAPGFVSFGASEQRYGQLRHSVAASAEVRPLEPVRLDARFRREYQSPLSLNPFVPYSLPPTLLICQYLSGRISYADPGRPNAYLLVGRDNLPDENKTLLRTGAGHEFTVLSTRLKLDGIIQSVALDDSTTRSLDHSLEYIADAGFTLPVPVRGNLRFRRNGLSAGDEAARDERELRGQLNVDAVPGLYYTGSYRSKIAGFTIASSRDASLDGYLYNDLQVAPGRWLDRLSIVNFSFGTGTNFEQYISTKARDMTETSDVSDRVPSRRILDSLNPLLPFFTLRPLDEPGIAGASDLLTWYGRVQVNPLASLLAWWKHTQSRSGSAQYGLPALRPTDEDQVRIEYEPAGLGVFIADWKHRVGHSLPRERRDNVYLEWSVPWNEKLRTKVTTSGRSDLDDYGTGSETSSELKAGTQVLYRFTARNYVTADLGLSRQAGGSTITKPQSVVSVLPGLEVNLNLLRFLFLQVGYTAALPFSGTSTHTLSGRVTGQF